MSRYAEAYDLIWRLEARLARSQSVEFSEFLEASSYYPPERLRQIQWNKLQALLAHAYSNVPFYRKRFDQLGVHPSDIRTREDFAKIPPLTRADLQNHSNDLIATNVSKSALIRDSTGGSTGKPVHFYIDKTYRQWVGSIRRVQDGWTGLKRGEPHAFLWGARIDLVKQNGPFKTRLANYLKRNLFLNSFEMDAATLRLYAERLTTFRPKLLTGYVLSLQLLARFIQENHLNPPFIGAIQTGAEPLREVQRKLIGAVLQAPVFEAYGGRDIGVIAHECEAHDGMHAFSLNYYLESVRNGRSALAGESGELLVTQLDNYGAPFIRYRADDLVVMSDRTCSCGRTYPLIDRVEGRVLDVIVGTNGRLLPGEFFPHFFKDFDIGEFQVVQKKRDLLKVNLIRGPSFTDAHDKQLVDTIKAYLGQDMQVQIAHVETIPPTSSGKFRVTISEIPFDWGQVDNGGT